jgi:S-adenosylmethionine:tRNA ribosyltransferase-isomerase
MGLELMQRVYAEAIREKYRFYSYGDACLLIRPR